MFVEESCFSEEDLSVYSVLDEKQWRNHWVSPQMHGLGVTVQGYRKDGWGSIKSHILPTKGTVGGSAEGKANTDGKSSLDFEVYVREKDDDGNSISVSAGSSVQRDEDGAVQASGSIKISVERDF
jgi:hypothetical protein